MHADVYRAPMHTREWHDMLQTPGIECHGKGGRKVRVAEGLGSHHDSAEIAKRQATVV